MARYDDVLAFWFGELDEFGCADEAHSERWWKKDDRFDEAIRKRFGALHEAVADGEHDDWLKAPHGRLAIVIVLDQFSRNMFRGTSRQFEFDPPALKAALEGVTIGADKRLGVDERSFHYMPLMHSEDLGAQDRCVELFTALRDAHAGEIRARVERSIEFAERHRAIIRRFGRFPHRNRVLGRTSTAEEVEFLTQPGSSF